MDSIRIIQLPTKSAVGTDDYIAVDSTANGTKKIQFPNLLDDGLTIQNKAADAKATGDAINAINGAIGNEASTRQSADANLQTQIDQLIAPSGEAPSAAEIENARIGAPPESTVYPTLGDAIRGQVTDLKSDLGEWYYSKSVSSRYPYIQLNSFGSRIFFKLIEPIANVTDLNVYGSNDNWQTQTQIYTQSVSVKGTEYYVDIPTGYTSLRFSLALSQSYTGTYEAIIHAVDNHTISQNVIDLWESVNTLDATIASSMTVLGDKLTGTNYNGFYLNTSPTQGIRSISNTAFNLKKYAVTANNKYYLIGKSVALNAALPIAAFGTAEVVDKNNYIEKILDGSATASDYSETYTPSMDGYIYIAWIENKGELELFDSQNIAIAVDELIAEDAKKDIKIQLFGDSITDNQWGDASTWANHITQMMPDYNVTIVNDAVGGSGIGHGKSTTTPSHQTEDYNYVYDLVTDGTTLQTDSDAVVILVGTNNWTSGTPLGDMSSSGYSTIYGALKGIIEYISSHSSATVFICTIPQRYNSVDQGRETNEYGEPINSQGNTLSEFCEPFRKVSAFYGMPCIHLNEALGWNRLNISQFTSDGLHPNADGDKMLASFICSEIKKHC